jgi:hypothetical protein
LVGVGGTLSKLDDTLQTGEIWVQRRSLKGVPACAWYSSPAAQTVMAWQAMPLKKKKEKSDTKL